MSQRAVVIHKSREILNSGLLREIVIWELEKSFKYPLGIKYRLVLVHPLWKKVIILFDNHFPKGPHWHDEKGNEFSYNFLSAESLMTDFFVQVRKQESMIENNEN